MNFATGQGFVTPDSNGKLNWNKPMTRAEAVKIIFDAIKQTNGYYKNNI